MHTRSVAMIETDLVQYVSMFETYLVFLSKLGSYQ
jgi:hypothetical protein